MLTRDRFETLNATIRQRIPLVNAHSLGKPLDFVLLRTLMVAQMAEGVAGDVAEIGVFKGTTFGYLCSGLQPGEKGFAVDIFDLNYPNSPWIPQEPFQDTMKAMAIPAEQYCVLKADTSKPEYRRQVMESIGSTCRLLHIDGDHIYENVAGECEIAEAVTADCEAPVIVFDDMFNVSYPDATEAVLCFLHHSPAFVPFALTPSKLYVTRHDQADRYLKYMSAFMRKQMTVIKKLCGGLCQLLQGDGPVSVKEGTFENLMALRQMPFVFKDYLERAR